MNKKTVIAIFTLGVLVLPGLCAALEIPLFVVTNAAHSDSVQLAEPSMDDAKDCAQHLGELLMEGLRVDDTNIRMFSPEKVVDGGGGVEYLSLFNLSNSSIRRPKTAIIVCRRYAPE